MKIIKNKLNIDTDKFAFYYREKDEKGNVLKNRCGRDFLYHTLSFYYPDHFNNILNNPKEIEENKTFGLMLGKYLAWTQVQFYKVPRLFKEYKLILKINNLEIKNFFNFVYAILLSRIKFNDVINNIKKCIDSNTACGIDYKIGFGGLLDHVVFVYGYDEKGLFIFDTLEGEQYGYKNTKIKENIKYLSFDEIRKKWTIFGRVWEVMKSI